MASIHVRILQVFPTHELKTSLGPTLRLCYLYLKLNAVPAPVETELAALKEKLLPMAGPA